MTMYRNVWNKCYAALCSISFHNSNGIKAFAVTGFKVDNYIVTEEMIYDADRYDYVIIRFVEADANTTSREMKLNGNKFRDRIHSGVRSENEGFALIDISNTPVADMPSIMPASCSGMVIGSQVAIMGFHFDATNLSLHSGIISSMLETNEGRQYIQYDASIRQGMSGSPVVSLETNRVIGVIGYRLTSLSRKYEQFKQIVEENITQLHSVIGEKHIGAIDPVQVLIASQNQLKQMGRELYKESHSSFGYAHTIDNLSNYLS